MRVSRSWIITMGWLAVGCVSRGGPDAGTDGGPSDLGVDQGQTDAGPILDGAACGFEQHLCEGRCIREHWSDAPRFGCRYSCPWEEPCPTPDGGRAYCEDGHCAVGECFTCETLEAECGSASDGCGGSVECGSCDPALRCQDNGCVPCPDEYEGSSAADPVDLGTMADIPNSRDVRYATLHDLTDEDWFVASIRDRSPRIVPGGGPPNFHVRLTDYPEGLAPVLEATFVCDSGTLSYRCGSGSTDLGGGTCRDDGADDESVHIFHDLDCTPNDGDDANGELLIRVTATENPDRPSALTTRWC